MARISRLETPRESRRSLHPSYDPETFGRIAERFARFIGTAKFLVYMTIFVTTWVIWNALGPTHLRFDEYPFIFLTLLLSLQASYAAPLILLAQNRQADRDRVTSQEDRARDERNLAVTEFMVREIAAMRKELIAEIKELMQQKYEESESSILLNTEKIKANKDKSFEFQEKQMHRIGIENIKQSRLNRLHKDKEQWEETFESARQIVPSLSCRLMVNIVNE